MTPQDGPSLEQYLETRLNLLTRMLEEKLEAADLRYQQRFEAQSKALEAALAAAKEAVVAALAGADRAVSKAETASDKRFEGVNEFRAQLADQQRTFMPRAEVDVLFKSISDKFTALEKIVDARTNERRGVQGGYGYAVGVVGFVLALLALWSFFRNIAH